MILKRSSSFAAVWDRVRTPFAVAATLAVLALLVHWGGVARPGPLFVAGVALLLSLVLVFGMLIWWLYLSPMPPQPYHVTTRSAEARQLVAAMVSLCGMLLIIGGLWDQVWHRTFGGFGNDFLWPPHMLLYSSLGLIALFAGGGMFVVMRGDGEIRTRFRREPLIGLLGLVACYMVASLPSDQIWHAIYGIDLTGWSLPHLLMAVCFTMIMLSAVAMQLSLVPATPWSGLRGLRHQELLALVLIAWATLGLLQSGTIDWENITAIGDDRGSVFRGAFWQRPEWLYPVVVASITFFVGNFALHALRRAGAATILALLVLGFRIAAITVLQAEQSGLKIEIVAHVLMLPPLLALDIWYASRLRQGQQPGTVTLGNLLAGVVFLVCGLPLIANMMIYPRISAATLPGMIVFGLLAALASGAAGARMGVWLGALDRPADAPAQVRPWVNWVAVGLLTTVIIAAVIFIFTSSPPSITT